MTVLSSVMPGLRDLRVPFAVGALWLATLVLALQNWSDVLLDIDGVSDVRRLFAAGLASLGTAALVFDTYLLGILAQGAANGLAGSTRLTGRLAEWERTSPGWRLKIAQRLQRPSRTARSFVESTIRERLQTISPTITSSVPRELVLDESDLASMRLSSEAPEQFQQCDRI